MEAGRESRIRGEIAADTSDVVMLGEKSPRRARRWLILRGLPLGGDHDLDMSIGHGERRDADRNARWSRRFENGSVNRVHTFELGYIGEEDLRRDHVRVIHSSRF